VWHTHTYILYHSHINTSTLTPTHAHPPTHAFTFTWSIPSPDQTQPFKPVVPDDADCFYCLQCMFLLCNIHPHPVMYIHTYISRNLHSYTMYYHSKYMFLLYKIHTYFVMYIHKLYSTIQVYVSTLWYSHTSWNVYSTKVP